MNMRCVLAVWGWIFFFFQAEDGIRDLVRSRGLGDVYKRQEVDEVTIAAGAEATFNDKTKEEGSMKTIAHITSVDVTGGENSTSVSHPFKVDSPTRNYVFTVGEDLSIQH
eukprot:TRINITY_DN27999_c0_g1_i1.p1 TRINITY_DN27999_c0_g1~~TRINITY_DN27999_c0_g1_i1.p1  ORF type:complete len:110 (-),score=55.05 TRINITY_DN27999_c0_g1_i1:191-520(-)